MPLHEVSMQVSLALALAAATLTDLKQAPEAPSVHLEREGERVNVSIDGAPFTSLRWDAGTGPFLHPVLGTSGEHLTRGFPIEARPGEAHDHPHHKSLWLAHGNVNGHDFWHAKDGSRQIKVIGVPMISSGGEGVACLALEWRADGEVQVKEQRTFRFGTNGAQRWIDVESRLRAPSLPTVFGDTKEGTSALRLAPGMRPDGAGACRNSEGVEGGDIWGKPARWVSYWGPTTSEAGEHVSFAAILDHPQNPRHPTTWHARKYGLVAANPFGLHDFLGGQAGRGDWTLPAHTTATFRWRFLFGSGEPSTDLLDAEFARFSGLAAPIPRSYSLVYSEDFASPEAAQRFAFTDPSKWRIAGGALELAKNSEYTPPHRSPRGIALLDLMVGDFVLEAQLEQTGREYGHRDLCLFFGYQSPSQFYYTHLATTPDQNAHNVFLVNGAPRTNLIEPLEQGVDWGTGKRHTVRLERRTSDGTITVWFDDMTQPVLQTTDSTLGAGRIGVGSFDDPGRVHSLQIWAKSATRTAREAF